MQCAQMTQMIIGEALTDHYVKEIVSRMQDHVRDIPELIGHSILAEECGRMVILITDWSSRQDCLQYHTQAGPTVNLSPGPSTCWPAVTS
jgi:hypothetical protein